MTNTRGRTRQPDYSAAAKWYRSAAEQGHAFAQHDVGTMYDWGEGAPQDYAEAARWYRRAAEQGDAFAQNNLGLLYAEGHGVPRDITLAGKWFILSAAQGHEPGNASLDEWKQKMNLDQIAEAQRLAREWKPKVER